ncbi:MAG: hypothetical protein NVSMB6_29860 [Burkholderiaceae bacterium]
MQRFVCSSTYNHPGPEQDQYRCRNNGCSRKSRSNDDYCYAGVKFVRGIYRAAACFYVFERQRNNDSKRKPDYRAHPKSLAKRDGETFAQ